MVTCSNCSAKPSVTYIGTGDLSVNYCASHLPSFLKKKGAEKLYVPFKAVNVEEPKPASKKQPAVKVEPVIEEVKVEEEAVEVTAADDASN